MKPTSTKRHPLATYAIDAAPRFLLRSNTELISSALLSLWRLRRNFASGIVLGLAGLVGLGVAGYDGNNLVNDSDGLVQLGWGIWLVGISGLGLIILVFVSLSDSNQRSG